MKTFSFILDLRLVDRIKGLRFALLKGTRLQLLKIFALSRGRKLQTQSLLFATILGMSPVPSHNLYTIAAASEAKTSASF